MKNFYISTALICLIAAAAGMLVWLAVHKFTFNNIQWMLVFVLFPAVIGWFVNLFRFYRHPEKMKNRRQYGGFCGRF